jgi:MOSC domain-containing protein YiiM
MKLGEVLSIQIAPDNSTTPRGVEQVKAVAGMGLEGDRYYNGTGTYSYEHDEAHEATLIEAEAIEALAREHKIEFSSAESRRNITTRGVALNHLVGREFRIGQALLRGIRLCEPCTHLEQVSGKPVRKGLIHRGGLRAQIVTSGLIRVGDAIETFPA